MNTKKSINKSKSDVLISFIMPILDPTKDIFIRLKKLEKALVNDLDMQNNFEFLIIFSISNIYLFDKSILKIFQNTNFIIKEVPKEGIYSAYNKGISFAKGCYLNFLGSDDKLNCDKKVWSKVKNILSKKAPILLISEVLPFSIMKKKIYNVKNKTQQIPPDLPLYHQGIFYKKELFHNNKFDTKLSIAADYYHFLNLCKIINNKNEFKFFSGITHEFCLDGFSSHPKNRIKLMKDIFLARNKSGFGLKFFHYKFLIKSIMRYLLFIFFGK